MKFRDFVRMTLLAMDGRKVFVSCIDERDAKRKFDDYVSMVEKYLYGHGVKANRANGVHMVRFDGGGLVRFYPWKLMMRGIDIEYSSTDEYELTRTAVPPDDDSDALHESYGLRSTNTSEGMPN